jgi:hypothetical protein
VLQEGVVAALAIFALTYLALAAGRVPFLSVDRPAAALALLLAERALGGSSPASDRYPGTIRPLSRASPSGPAGTGTGTK